MYFFSFLEHVSTFCIVSTYSKEQFLSIAKSLSTIMKIFLCSKFNAGITLTPLPRIQLDLINRLPSPRRDISAKLKKLSSPYYSPIA